MNDCKGKGKDTILALFYAFSYFFQVFLAGFALLVTRELKIGWLKVVLFKIIRGQAKPLLQTLLDWKFWRAGTTVFCCMKRPVDFLWVPGYHFRCCFRFRFRFVEIRLSIISIINQTLEVIRVMQSFLSNDDYHYFLNTSKALCGEVKRKTTHPAPNREKSVEYLERTRAFKLYCSAR